MAHLQTRSCRTLHSTEAAGRAQLGVPREQPMQQATVQGHPIVRSAALVESKDAWKDSRGACLTVHLGVLTDQQAGQVYSAALTKWPASADEDDSQEPSDLEKTRQRLNRCGLAYNKGWPPPPAAQ